MSNYPVFDEFHARMSEIPEWGRKMLGDMMIKMEEDANMIVDLRSKLEVAENRLEKSPYGDDKIDELEEALGFLKHDRDVLQAQVNVLQQALREIATHTMYFDGEQIPTEAAIIAAGALGTYKRATIEQEVHDSSE